MSNDTTKAQGIDLDKVTIDANGEVDGLDDDLLDSVAGGLAAGPGCNYNCIDPIGGGTIPN